MAADLELREDGVVDHAGAEDQAWERERLGLEAALLVDRPREQHPERGVRAVAHRERVIRQTAVATSASATSWSATITARSSSSESPQSWCQRRAITSALSPAASASPAWKARSDITEDAR
jgi:hypothetical protein